MINRNNLFDVFNEDEKYTKKIEIPQYKPSNEKPNIVHLVDDRKYKKLMQDIDNSGISQEDKAFLKLAASRHLVFRYDKIADYYANSSKDVQKLMEDSGLVIIDIGDAIMNGFVDTNKKILDIINNHSRKAKSNEG